MNLCQKSESFESVEEGGSVIVFTKDNTSVSAMSMQAAIPSQPRSKALRACLLCAVIQNPLEFKRNGCPNCEEIMQASSLGCVSSSPSDSV